MRTVFFGILLFIALLYPSPLYACNTSIAMTDSKPVEYSVPKVKNPKDIAFVGKVISKRKTLFGSHVVKIRVDKPGKGTRRNQIIKVKYSECDYCGDPQFSVGETKPVILTSKFLSYKYDSFCS